MNKEEIQKDHRLALDNSELALMAFRTGDTEKFRQLSQVALTYEKKAALALYNQSIEPTRSVLFRSAAYIALDNADFVEAQKLYEYALDGQVPNEIKIELAELKREIDRIRTENEGLIQNALTFLNNRIKPITKEQIIGDIERSKKSFNENDINIDYVYSYLEKQLSVDSERHVTLEENYEPWIYHRKGFVEKRFWDRYTKYLLKEQRFALDTIHKLDDITDDILDHLKDPLSEGDWDKRGLVVGQVQSGKTSNYTGLICKAADYGYKVIVILAGTTNDLRSQTQLRTDAGFLGWDTRASKQIGVSSYGPADMPHYFTNSAMDGDFKTSSSYVTGTNPRSGQTVVVIKKNTTVLKELISWFASRAETLQDGHVLVKQMPVLVIDDEADNASINVSSESASTINGLIRALLSLFQRSAYVGYTATPFANVFIPVPLGPDYSIRGLDIQNPNTWSNLTNDLFPKDFIINIPPPSNYIGPKEIFGIDPNFTLESPQGQEGLPLLRDLFDADYLEFFPDKHRRSDPLPEELPESLKQAILSFILVCAIRRTRGQIEVHNSMLVHVTRFVRWQNKTATLITRLVRSYQELIQQEDSQLIAEIKNLYERDFIGTTAKINSIPAYQNSGFTIADWNEIQSQLNKAASKIQIRAIHGDSSQEGLEFDNVTSLDYHNYRQTGLTVIAVGGNKLSRGLTLEGLSISYYLRASKMYDTLMQMGRWFGYRPGYLDLCRLYTSDELTRWYKYITVASEELRAEFADMKLKRKTPKEYGVKVRQHPDVLKITATNKMRDSHLMELSFADKLRETWSFKRDIKIFESNYTRTASFVNSLGPAKPKNGQSYVWYKQDNSSDVTRFLDGYNGENNLEKEKIIEYIKEQVKAGYLLSWTIVLISNQRDIQPQLFKINNQFVSVGLTMRSDNNEGQGNYYELRKSHIIDPTHEFIDFDLNSIEYQDALSRTIEDWRNSTRSNKGLTAPTIPSGKNIRAKRPTTQGLLLIYPLVPTPKGWENSGIENPIIGYAISFPKNETEKIISYRVNQVFMDEFNYEDDPELEELTAQ
ncbi:Z1 domain-containing protein [Flavitalea antarctica]